MQSTMGPPDCPVDRSLPNDQVGFIALDVETGNADISSICQIAAVRFVAGEAVDVWHSFVNPGEPFAELNVSLHGIDATSVEGAPDFPAVMRTLSALLTGEVVASHMPFDRIAVERACLKHRIPPVNCFWIDSARVARRAWPRFAKKGYGLRSLASWCGIDFRHHDAIEDARAAGRILTHAIADSGISVDKWVNYSPPKSSNSPRVEGRDRLRGTYPRRLPLRYAARAAKDLRAQNHLSVSRP